MLKNRNLMGAIVAGITNSTMIFSLSDPTHASSCWSSSFSTACCYGTTVKSVPNPCQRLREEGPVSQKKPFGSAVDYPSQEYDLTCVPKICPGYRGNNIY